MEKTLASLLLLTIIASTLLTTSCNRTSVFEEEHRFSSSSWQRFTPEEYKFTIKDCDPCYHIKATVSIDTNLYQASSLPLIVNLYDDQGEQRMFTHTIVLRERTGARRGTVTGHYQKAEINLKEFFYFSHKGDYRLSIKQATSSYSISGVEALTVSVEKAPLVIPQ